MKTKTIFNFNDISSLKRYPTKALTSTIPKPGFTFLSTRSFILLTDHRNTPRMYPKIFARTLCKINQVESTRPFMTPLNGCLLRIITKIPCKIHNSCLPSQQTIEILDSILISKYHETNCNWPKETVKWKI